MRLPTFINSGGVLVLGLAIASLIFVGCDSGGGAGDDDGGGGADLASEEAKTTLQNVDTDLAADFNELSGGEFALTIQDLFFGGSGFTTAATGKQTSTPLGFTLIDALSAEGIVQTANGRLSFQTGEYNWNSSNGAWGPSTSSNNLVLNFPTVAGGSNNATFTLAAYTDEAVTIDGRTEYLPKTIDVSLSVAGTEIFAIDLSGTEFYPETLDLSDDATQIPRQFLLQILTAPQRHTFDFNSPSKREFDFDFELEKASNQQRVLRFLIGVTLSEDFDAVSSTQSVQTVDGEIGIGPNLTVAYSVDVDGANNLGDNPSIQEINDQFDATVRYQGRRVGTIEWGQTTVENTQIETALLVYNDGSRDPLATAFANTFGTVTSTGGMVTATVKSAADRMKRAVAKMF